MPRLSGPARLWIFGTILWIAFLLWRTNEGFLTDVSCILWDPGPWCVEQVPGRETYSFAESCCEGTSTRICLAS